jgi:RNA polymerase sigma-70 factor (ECF subfamily)
MLRGQGAILLPFTLLSCGDVAGVCSVPVGTIKSRINRAGIRLVKLLQMKDRTEIGPDGLMKAALLGAVRS